MSPFKSLRIELTRAEFAAVRTAADGATGARTKLNEILGLTGAAVIPDLAKVELVVVPGAM